MHMDYDRIFLEFGHLKNTAKEQISLNRVIFDEQNEKSSKIVIRTNVSFSNNFFFLEKNKYTLIKTSISILLFGTFRFLGYLFSKDMV